MAASKIIRRKRNTATKQSAPTEKASPSMLTIEDGKLPDLAAAINQECSRARDSYYEHVERLGTLLEQAHAIFAGKGREGKWGKWLATNTPLDRTQAHRVLAIKKRTSVVHAQHLLPSNDRQWQALEGVPDEKLNDVLEQTAELPKITAKALKILAAPYKPPKEDDVGQDFPTLQAETGDKVRRLYAKWPQEQAGEIKHSLERLLDEDHNAWFNHPPAQHQSPRTGGKLEQVSTTAKQAHQ